MKFHLVMNQITKFEDFDVEMIGCFKQENVEF